VALLDPLLTVSMPPQVTANTGIDALTHALEGFTSVNAQPVSDLLALESITLIDRHLPKAVFDGSDLLARTQVLFASMLAGMVIAQTGTTLIHGMGYALTTWYGIPHGLANGVLMPQVAAFNGQQVPQRYARLAAALGLRADPDRGAEAVVHALRSLRDRVLMLSRLRDLGVDKEHLEQMARQTMQHTRNLVNNVRPVSFEDVLRIYQESY
jgi:alcohol dehydrogenase